MKVKAKCNKCCTLMLTGMVSCDPKNSSLKLKAGSWHLARLSQLFFDKTLLFNGLLPEQSSQSGESHETTVFFLAWHESQETSKKVDSFYSFLKSFLLESW